MAPNVYHVTQIYFQLRGHNFDPKNPRHRIVMRRHSKDAKELLQITEGEAEQMAAITQRIIKVKEWAESQSLSWNLGTVVKRWFEDNVLEKRPFYVYGGKKFKAKQDEDGVWWVEDGGWKRLNTRYARPAEVIVYE
jgi:hypothetical protein